MTAERDPRSRRRIFALAALFAVLLIGSTALVWSAGVEADGAAGTIAAAASGVSPETDAVATASRARGKDAPRPNARDARDVAGREAPDGVAIGGRRDGATPNAAAVDPAADKGDGARRPDAAGPAGANARSATDAGGAVRRGGVTADEPTLVLVVHVKAAESETFLADADVQVSADDGVARKCRTDYQGRAAFVVAPGATMRVEAKSPGRVRKRVIVATTRAAETAVVVPLERGVVVQGRVTDGKGAVDGGSVTAFLLDPWLKAPPYDADPAPIETTTTDRKGAYRLDCIPRGVPCVLVVEADGRVPRYEHVLPQPDPDFVVRIDSTLERAAAMDGIVSDAARNPVRGACVFAVYAVVPTMEQSPDSGLSEDDREELRVLQILVESRAVGWWRPPRATTDADGRFRLIVPADGRKRRLIAMHPTAGRSGVSRPIVAGSERVDLVLRGRVRADFDVRTSNDKPSRGASVVPFFPWEAWSVVEGAPGNYGYAEMDDGPIVVRVTGVKDAPGVYVGRRVDADRLTWRVKLREGVAWSGVVRDDRGTPVGAATVTAGERSTLTDELGQFFVEGVHPDLTSIDVTAAGFTPSSYSASGTRRTHVEVVLTRTATFRVRLSLPDGAAKPTWRRIRSGGSSSGADAAQDDQLDWFDGVIEMKDWNVRNDRLAVFVPGYAILVRDVAAKPGAALDLGTIPLVRARRIRAAVVDDGGHPVTGAQILVEAVGSEAWTTMVPPRVVDADVRGGFEIEVAAPGQTYRVVASAPGYAPTPQSIDVASKDVQRVVIGRERLFRGRALDLSPTDSTVVAVLLGATREVYARAAVDSNGRFEADVPRTPHWVAIKSSSDKLIRETVVPADFVDGTVFEFSK